MYHDGCLKAAIGSHIIHTAGNQVGMSEELMQQNAHTLINIFADGIGMPRLSVWEDVINLLDGLTPEFTSSTRYKKLIMGMTATLAKMELISLPPAS